MAEPFHVYRLSDCMERAYRSADPVLIIPCNNACRPGTDSCVHDCVFARLADLPVQIIAVHHRDLPEVLLLHRGLGWGHALLMREGQVIRHWSAIPSRTELEAALASSVAAH